MLDWFINNAATLAVGLILCAIVTGVIVYMIRQKKKGKSSCGCGCGNCAMNGICHQVKKDS